MAGIVKLVWPLLVSSSMMHILIVDDERNLLKNLKSFLSSFEEYRILTAASAEGALALIEVHPIDVLLTDVRLPKMDGIELVKRTLRRYPSVRVIVMTAYSSPDIRADALREGALRFVEKPIDLNDLRTLLQEIDSSTKGWSGQIENLDVLDFAQLIALGRKTRAIRVFRGVDQGLLYFLRGKLIHASSDRLEGDEAFLEIAKWQDGVFQDASIKDDSKHPKPNIASSFDFLILEAARQRDHAAREETEGEQVSKTLHVASRVAADGDKTPQNDKTQERKEEMAIKDHLGDISEVEGFKGIGVFTAQGEALEVLTSGKLDIKTVGMFANNALLNSQKATDKMGVGRGNLMTIRAPQATVIMRCLNEATDFAASKSGKAHFHTVVVMDPDGNTGMATMLLDRVVEKLAEEMR